MQSPAKYLETILALGKKNNLVRAVDISNEMGVSKASVSRALAAEKPVMYHRGQRRAHRLWKRPPHHQHLSPPSGAHAVHHGPRGR